MGSVSGFLQQAYWWLSLLGGLHCAVLALLLWVKNFSNNRTQQMIVIAIFITLSIYFLTGTINRENAPLPIHIVLAMITPIYFLLMPLLYFYCKNELNYQQSLENKALVWHYAPALIVALIVLFFTITHFNTQAFLISESTHAKHINTFSLLGMALPTVLLVQTGGYFFAIIRAIKVRKDKEPEIPGSPVDDLKIKWLLVLAIAIIINWLIRCVLASLPFVFGEQYWLIIQTVIRFNLLVTLYILAIYRLQQLTVIAYQNGLVARNYDKKEQQHADLLDDEEKHFLSKVFEEKK